MKGGYQILDLTGATAGSPVEVKGIYKAAAGNNGKPVMILTNDGQRVYAEIAEDDGDFITCYVSAEGKTVNITIKSDDSVTTVISDPGASITGLEQAVNELNDNIGANRLGTGVDLSQYNTNSNLYTFPSDGYVCVDIYGSGTDYTLMIYGATGDDNSRFGFNTTKGSNADAYNALFVKKGMRCYVYSKSASDASAHFIPLE